MPDFGEETAVAAELVKLLTGRGKMIAVAESCTAGLVADMIARIPGASKVLWGSYVTYTADAKTKMLEVPKGLIDRHGAVSSPVALAMAEGALARSGASWAVSITGLAGPGGEGAPVGTVWIGLAGPARAGARPRAQSEAKRFLFSGSRNEVRTAAAVAALNELLRKILTAEEFLV
jgi:PncC family amidohydrolase